LNTLDKPIISIDINSGLNGNNGLAKIAVKSDLTVSLGHLKPGLLLNQAKDLVGKLVNVDIGVLCEEEKMQLIEKKDLSEFLKPRLNCSNKGTYGYVGIMGGSANYPGALRLANLGQVALRSGCGVSRVIVPDDIYQLIFNKNRVLYG
jgi:NAD(P)H-hydrate epimerase